MKRFFAALMLCVSMLFVLPAQSGAAIFKNSWRFKECRYQTLNGLKGWSDQEVKDTIRCAVAHFPVSGGVDRAFCYAAHESGFNEWAANPYSSAAGIFQVVDGTWDGWYSKHDGLVDRWGVGYPRVPNARNNVVIAIRHVHSFGWGAWANYAHYSC